MSRISEVMQEKGVTTEKLSLATGIPKTTINEYRSSRKKEPSLSRGLKIADALGVDPHDLLEK